MKTNRSSMILLNAGAFITITNNGGRTATTQFVSERIVGKKNLKVAFFQFTAKS